MKFKKDQFKGAAYREAKKKPPNKPPQPLPLPRHPPPNPNALIHNAKREEASRFDSSMVEKDLGVVPLVSDLLNYHV